MTDSTPPPWLDTFNEQADEAGYLLINAATFGLGGWALDKLGFTNRVDKTSEAFKWGERVDTAISLITLRPTHIIGSAATGLKAIWRTGETWVGIAGRKIGKLGEKMLEVMRPGGKPQRYAVDSTGRGRYHDLYLPKERTALEAKVGRQPGTVRNLEQANRDAAIMEIPDNTGVAATEWHFFRSPHTNKIGPTNTLRQELETRNIKVVEHPDVSLKDVKK